MLPFVSKAKYRPIVHVFLASAILAGILALAATPAALAAGGPTNPNCWGVVVSQRASTVHDIGQHASSQSVPRLGIGNTARLLFSLGLTAGPHPSDLGSFLASVDNLAATHCP